MPRKSRAVVVHSTALSVAIGLLAISVLFLVMSVLWNCGKGFDLTDEGNSLVAVARPWMYPVTASQFAWVYRPLYVGVNAYLPLYRQFNVIITFCLGWVLFALLLEMAFPRDFGGRLQRWTIAFIASSSALLVTTFNDLWAPVPNYNSLAIQSLLLTGIGLAGVTEKSERTARLPWVLIGVGGALAFLAKPTTAAVLGVSVGLYLVAFARSSIRYWVLAAFTSCVTLMTAALIIDGSPLRFLDRLRWARRFGKISQGGHDLGLIVRWDAVVFSDSSLRAWLLLCVLVAALSCVILVSSRRGVVTAIVALCGSLLTASLIVVPPLSISRADPSWMVLMSPMVLGLIPAIVLAGFQQRWSKNVRRSLGLSILFLVFLYAYVFGTTNNYSHASGTASIFWVAAMICALGVVLDNRHRFVGLIAFVAIVPPITSFILCRAAMHPYRQDVPLKFQVTSAESVRPLEGLSIRRDMAMYLDEIVTSARRVGFPEGGPMIDISGRSPGVLYALGARSLGSSWLIGGYLGSSALAAAGLDRADCRDIAGAWLFGDQFNFRRIRPSVLRSQGIDLANHYAPVASVKSLSNGGPRQYNQYIYRPLRDPKEAELACINARETRARLRAAARVGR